MDRNSKDVERLDELDTGLLEKKGWHFVTYYQSREGGEGSSAYNKAMEKALNHKRKAGIRTHIKDGVTYYELWEYWQ